MEGCQDDKRGGGFLGGESEGLRPGFVVHVCVVDRADRHLLAQAHNAIDRHSISAFKEGDPVAKLHRRLGLGADP